MTTDVIDLNIHTSAFPATYIGKGTLIGNPYYTAESDLLTGYFTSDGNAVSIDAGFQVQGVKIVNETDVIVWEWQRGLAATKTLKTVAGGTLTDDATTAILVTTGDGRSNVLLSAALVGSAKNILFKITG